MSCYYARDYISKAGGFNRCITNSAILNFKKSPIADGQQYRTQAINLFAQEAQLLIDCKDNKTFTVTAIPSSKSKDDPNYDNRFEDFFNVLRVLRPCIKVQWPVRIKNSTDPTHLAKGIRDPKIIASNYIYHGLTSDLPDSLLVFDDVLTTGAHFRAFKDFIRSSGYAGNVYGIFWAKAKSIT